MDDHDMTPSSSPPSAPPSARRRTARCAARGPTSSAATVDRARRCGARPASTRPTIDDVILGCAMPEAEQGLNVARIASLRAGVPVQRVGGHRQPLLLVRPAGDRLRRRAHHVRLGVGDRRRRHRVDEPGADGRQQGRRRTRRWSTRYPDVYLSTGLVAENHARESGISREEQDAFALRSHQRALAAIDAGRFADEIVPVTARGRRPGDRPRPVATSTFAVDEGPRRDTSLEALAKLRPAFHATGSVTAGNSSQTSDGAAAVIVTSAELRAASAA